MPKFVFRLQSVLRHREHVEQERLRDLALAQAEMTRLQNELKALNDALQSTASDLKLNHLSGPLDVNYLAAHRRYTVAMQRKGLTLVQDMARQQKKVDEAQRLHAEAARERKVIEKLRGKQHDRWAAETARKEAARLDEVGMQMAYREHVATADNTDGDPDRAPEEPTA